MNEFDAWRAGYNARTFAEEMAYHNELEAKYPSQAHYNEQAARLVFEMCRPVRVVEAGAWKADLAALILAAHPQMESWTAYEICTAAIEKTVCTDSRFKYGLITTFDWFGQWLYFKYCDLFLATHFIEHLSDAHFVRLANALDTANVPYIYFEAPITDEGNTWEGYPGTHILEMGWGHIEKLLSNYAMAAIAPGCMLFTRKP
jgi:hypothetical protein